ncbi:MAG: hypothetical protein LBD11_08620 [Candidatus Peribacteria bacterium]|jgi:hypothetical protein|nr:hypothetical protein [Candidatus Peribacteria bacterium]
MSKSATIPSLKTVAFFEEKTIRRERYNDEWRFSIVDIVSILTQSSQASRYWRELKDQLAKYE